MEKVKINLLFVDDEEEYLESMGKRLRARGFTVITACRGDEAIEAARNNPVDIALLDVKMPGTMDGEDTFNALKQEHRWIEAVMLTGHISVAAGMGSHENGPFAWLQKPCELDKILEALNNAYQKSILNRKEMGGDVNLL